MVWVIVDVVGGVGGEAGVMVVVVLSASSVVLKKREVMPWLHS